MSRSAHHRFLSALQLLPSLLSRPARLFQPALPLLQALLLGLTLAGPACAGSMVSHVYPLQHQTGDNMLPSLRAALQPGETVNLYNNEVIVTASEQSQQQVASLIEQLDRPLRNLLIEVRRHGIAGSDDGDTRVSGGIQQGTVYLGNNGQAYQGGHEIRSTRGNGIIIGDNQAQIRSSHEIHSTVQQQTQKIRVMEGYPALISRGESRPVRQYDRYGNAVTDYRSADSGIYVTAHITGNRVLLDISAGNDHFNDDQSHGNQSNNGRTHDDRYRSNANSISTEQLRTRVSGGIGEWIDLGGISEQASHSGSSYSGSDSANLGDTAGLSVRITTLDGE